MRLNGPSAPASGFTTLASFAIVAALLYFAKEVFIPIALASLLTFLLAPLVVRLGRIGLGKVPAIGIVVILAFAIISGLGWIMATQIIHLANELPEYQQNLQAKVRTLMKTERDGVISRATGVVKQLQKEMENRESDGTNSIPGQMPQKPVPVEVQPARASSVQLIGSVLGPVMKPLATAGAVAFFVIFMLFQREDLRERFLKLVSGGELNVATQAVDDAARRVSRYLLMQLVVNATYGLPIGIGLYFIGVPNAFLWGLLATLLRFIPFIGPWIAASFPMLLAVAVDPGWTKPLLSIALFVVVELISNNLVEPWLYGASTGVSNVALLVAAVFWTWLWGPVGLLLSTPMTVCLLVLGKYVPGLSFLSVLLGSEPVLDPEARLYQRMLAMDEDELMALAGKFRTERSLTELYDSVLIPALTLAEEDRHKGTLAEVRQAFIAQNTRELIELLGDENLERKAKSDPAPEPIVPHDWPPVLCIPARDEADELAVAMLVQLAQQKGIPAHPVSVKTVPAEWFRHIRREHVAVVCISAIPPFAVSAARQVCKRIKQAFPRVKIIVGIWNVTAQPTEIANRFGTSCSDAIVTRLPEAIARIESLMAAEERAARRAPARPLQPAVQSAPAAAEVEEAEPGEVFSSVSRQIAKVLNVPVSQVSLIDTDREFWTTHGGFPPDLGSGDVLRASMLNEAAATTEEMVEVEDITKDPRLSSDPVLKERGIRFYAGVPLRTSDGRLVGTLCVTDTEPHQITDRARALLCSLAGRLVQEVERRSLQPAA
jgi:predicted PurR-regulated permease PerM/GAF domain-containing protein